MNQRTNTARYNSYRGCCEPEPKKQMPTLKQIEKGLLNKVNGGDVKLQFSGKDGRNPKMNVTFRFPEARNFEYVCFSIVDNYLFMTFTNSSRDLGYKVTDRGAGNGHCYSSVGGINGEKMLPFEGEYSIQQYDDGDFPIFYIERTAE